MRFTDLLAQHNVLLFTEGKYCRRGWVQFHCPFCFGGLDPNKPYCGYNLARNYVNCWRCGGHSLAEVLVTLTAMTYREAKQAIGELDSPAPFDDYRPQGKLKLPEGVDALLPAHRKYLKRRGFDPDEIERLWHVQGIGPAVPLQWRLFIPIHFRSRLVSWTTRSISNSVSLRYVAASEEDETISNKCLLYGEDFASHSISIHEGHLDVWAIGPGAVATGGTAWTPAQVLRMSRYPRRLVCFDSEKQAQKRAKKLCRLLEVFPGETMNVVLDAKDAAAASDREKKQLRKMLR